MFYFSYWLCVIAIITYVPPNTSSLDIKKTAEFLKPFNDINWAEKKEALSQYIKTHANGAYEQYFKDYMNDWQKYPLHIAVSGSSGQGKSSLINTLRSLKPSEVGAAKVGEIECSQNVAMYPDPQNSNLIYYDLPGVGTRNFPRAKYFEIIKEQAKGIGLEDFDFFLIVSATRFTENDIWLAKEVNNAGKQFYFIRTKVDIDLYNSRRNYPDNYSEKNVLETIRNNCLQELNKIDFGTSKPINTNWTEKLFLLSTVLDDANKWDFSRMATSLVTNFPILKREAIIMSIKPFSKAIIHEKAEALRSRIWVFVLVSGAVGAIPYPGTTIGGTTAVGLVAEQYFREQLNLDVKSLAILEESHDTKADAVLSQLLREARFSMYFSTTHTDASYVVTPESSNAAYEGLVAILDFFPILKNPVVGGAGSIVITLIQLRETVDHLEKAAINVADYLISASLKPKRNHDEL